MDYEKLAEIKLDFPDFNFESDLGFEKFDLDLIFADTDLGNDVFNEDTEVKDEFEKLREIDKLKAAKKAHREAARNQNLSGDTNMLENDDYMVTVVFPNTQEKKAFMKLIKEKPNENYIKHTKIYDIQDGKLKAYGK